MLPHESYLNIHYNYNVTTFTKNNCMAYFLDEIKYEINGSEIDKKRFFGMTTTLSLDNL